jgi:hypothetical protein
LERTYRQRRVYARPSRRLGSETTRVRALGKEGELKEGKVGVDDLMLLGLKYLAIVQAGVTVAVVEQCSSRYTRYPARGHFTTVTTVKAKGRILLQHKRPIPHRLASRDDVGYQKWQTVPDGEPDWTFP